MKLTNRALIKKSEKGATTETMRTAFYREQSEGKLYSREAGNKRAVTEEAVGMLDFERSWMGKLRKESQTKNEEFEVFIKCLVSYEQSSIVEVPDGNWERYLTSYGRNIKARGGKYTLIQLLNWKTSVISL